MENSTNNEICEQADVNTNRNIAAPELRRVDYIYCNLKAENGTFRKYVAKALSAKENDYTCKF